MRGKLLAIFNLSKRQKFAAATIILLFGIIFIRVSGVEMFPWRVRVGGFSILAVLVTIFALKDDDFSGVEWFLLPILPVFYAVGSALVYPLLPMRMESVLGFVVRSDTGFVLGVLVRMIFLGLFVIGFYATLLTSNIYNVAGVKGIQLLRVAHSIGFLATVATALFFFVVVSSFHLTSFENFLAVFLISIPLALQSIWSINLEEKIGEEVRNFTFVTALILAETAWVLSFWPLGVSIYALFLTALLYEVLGIVQFHLGEKLSLRIVNEFVAVAVVVFLLTIFTTVWGA